MKFIFEKEYDKYDDNNPADSVAASNNNTTRNTASNDLYTNVEFSVDLSSSSSLASESADNTPPNEPNHYRQECSTDCPNHHSKLALNLIKHNDSFRSLSDIFGRTFLTG